MEESYEENPGRAKPLPGSENRKKGYSDLNRDFQWALNAVITIAGDLDTIREQRQRNGNDFSTINNNELLGVTSQLIVACKRMFDIFDVVMQSARIVELSSMCYEEELVNRMCKDILGELYDEMGIKRKK